MFRNDAIPTNRSSVSAAGAGADSWGVGFGAIARRRAAGRAPG